MPWKRRSFWRALLTAALLAAFSCGGRPAQGPPATNPSVIGYVVNSRGNTVSSFLLDEQTGALTQGTTASTGALPVYPAVTPDRRLLFVSNGRDGTISRFLLDGNGGIQTAGPAVPVLSPDGQPFQLAVAPSGRFLFAGTTANAVEVFGIDTQTGDLHPIPNSPFPVASKATQLALTHSGQYLYAIGDNADAIYVFTVDLTTGGLTPLAASPVHTSLDPNSLALDSSDTYLFVTTYHAEKLLIYRIQASGDLRETTTSGIATGYGPLQTALAPNGKFAFLPALFDNNILGFSFDPTTAAIAPAPGSPFHDGQTPSSVAVSPKGSIAVVSRINPGHVASYRIDQQTGALSPISGSLSTSGLVTGDNPNNVLLVPK